MTAPMRRPSLVLLVLALLVAWGALLVLPAGHASAGGSPATDLKISEFRVRGPNGANDEFIEIYNSGESPHTVAGGGTGYAVAASNGVARCVIPNGTVIPARGHYLCVNSVGYGLASYPAGNGTTATGDATYTTDIPDNAGIALFSTSVAGDFTLANRLDAVGSTSEANTVYKEGAGYPALVAFSIDYSFYRDFCTSRQNPPPPAPQSLTLVCAQSDGTVKDTNDNAADFIFVDTNGTSAGAGQRLGAAGPENLSSPVQSNGSLPVSLLDPCVAEGSPPNTVRDFTSDPANNSVFGTLDIRRTVTNDTGAGVTRLRVRVIDIDTFPSPSGIADLRPRTSTALVTTVDRGPCGSGTSNVTVQGTTLETPPSQLNGGGFNSSLSASTVTLATPLAPGASIDLRFLFGIQQTGDYRVLFNVEALPGGGSGAASGQCGGTDAGDVCSLLGNFAPVANDDSYTTDEDTTLAVADGSNDVLANDTDADGDTLEVADGNTSDTDDPGEVDPVSGPSDGTLTLRDNGSFDYTPDAGFTGTDSFVYSVSDGNGREDMATVTISVEVPVPAASINDVMVTEGNSGTVPATFTVTLSSASTGTVSYGWSTANGTATAPADYQTASGTVTFAPGDTSETLTVNVVGDTVDEPNQTFTVTLSAPVNGTIADGTGTGTILDDDGGPVVTPSPTVTASPTVTPSPTARALPNTETIAGDTPMGSIAILAAMIAVVSGSALAASRRRVRAGR